MSEAKSPTEVFVDEMRVILTGAQTAMQKQEFEDFVRGLFKGVFPDEQIEEMLRDEAP